MRIIFYSTLLLLFVAFISCNSNRRQKKEGVITETSDTVNSEEKEELPPPPPLPPPPQTIFMGFHAQMIYDDGTLSSFDVFSDKTTKALWNVIIGEGDAEKPSNKTRLLFTSGNRVDSLSLVVTRGKDTVLTKKNLVIKDSVVYVINHTGCETVVVDIKRNGQNVYLGTIDYRCGE